MEKAIYWDMDGTIANLYGVENWLENLEAEETRPYEVAEPMCDMKALGEILAALRELGYVIGVISWLSKNGSKEYNNRVRRAKRNWLEEQGILDVMHELHFVKYGTPKHTTANIRHGILVDDNAEVREAWERYGGETIDPTVENILDIFHAMIEEEEMA